MRMGKVYDATEYPRPARSSSVLQYKLTTSALATHVAEQLSTQAADAEWHMIL